VRNHEKYPPLGDEIELEDGEGNLMFLRRVEGCLKIEIYYGRKYSYFMASATHVGKMFEFVVDMFFPQGVKGDESAEDSQDSRSE
jgi:hypothetical protein